MLFADMGYPVLVPIFVTSILIIIKFPGMSLLTAITVLIIFHAISLLLPV